MATTISPVSSNQVEEILKILNIRPVAKTKTWWNSLETWDKRLWILTASGLIVAVFFAAVGKVFNYRSRWIVDLSYAMLLIGQLAYAVTIGRYGYSQVKSLFRPIDTYFATVRPTISDDYLLLLQLQTYDASALDFVSNRLKMEVGQFRKRISIIAPGIEKLGFLPAVAGAIIAFLKDVPELKLLASLKIAPNTVALISLAIGFIYLTAMMMIWASFRLDQLAQLVTVAASKLRDK